MKQYLDIVKKVLTEGKWKSPVRKEGDKWVPVDGGVRTLTCPNVVFSHDMEEGFPLLTTKRMAFKTMCVELEGFINGVTDKKWYQDRNCRIWSEWANPEAVSNFWEERCLHFGDNSPMTPEDKKFIQSTEMDLGPIYGSQWRNFNGHYGDIDFHETEWHLFANGVYQGFDQLKNIVETLRTNPMDRRMVCSAWNPNQMHMMALPPCHTQWGCTVIGDYLHLNWSQRSVDLPIGACFNIASYALLLCLLAEIGGFKRGNLSAMWTDCHIYEHQIDGCRKQLKREPRELPELCLDGFTDIFDWTHDQVRLEGYNPMEKIDFGQIVV